MKNTILRKGLSFLLSLMLIFSMVPWVSAQEETSANMGEPAYTAAALEFPAETSTEEIPEEAYDSVKNVFAEISKMEKEPAKKNVTETQLSLAAEEIVKQSENYVIGSLERNGNTFTWDTTDGIGCIYDPYMRKINSEMKAPENPMEDGIYNAPKATKGGSPSGKEVVLVAPYYGYDDRFTGLYMDQAEAVAQTIGDTSGYTLISGTAATIDTVALAVSYGSVVFFDSHGSTDYTNQDNAADQVSQATTSYLCLKSANGLTADDYDLGADIGVDADGNITAYVNGYNIAWHQMLNSFPQAPDSFVWMAFCLGMATNTICGPLRNYCGVDVVYGYSQSISFLGDYCFELAFWEEFLNGSTVGEAVAASKDTVGYWDWSDVIWYMHYSVYGDSVLYMPYYTDITSARKSYQAFPIVVSDEDTYPGRRTATSFGVDSLQTVQSTYTLLPQEPVVQSSDGTTYTSFDEALENYDSNSQYLILLKDQQVELTVDQDLYIDLNGHSLTGIIDVTSGQIYGMDSTTDEYTCDEIGYFYCEDSRGCPVVPKKHFKSDITGQVKRYLTVQTAEGYSFHRIYLAVSHMTVRPSVTGVGYKAVFYGDEMVVDALDAENAFGYSLQLGSYAPVTGYMVADSFESGKTVTLRIDNYDVENHGLTELKASAVLRLADGTVITSSEVTMTMRGFMEQLNTSWSTLSEEQLTAIKEMIERNPIIKTWQADNLY